ncbi:MAG: 30S ribosomal protein S2 [Anaerolineae bacterium]|nr:MAG: 30S ribosomal protein S2 [Anaerolineae bacterium]
MSAPSSSVVSLKALLETGVHFGHQARKWNPKMKPYIFTKRNGIHIIDLQQTVVTVNEVYDLVRDSVARRGTILYVGTKRQAQETIASEAERVGMPYVNTRWLGGTLTNWKTIKQRIDTLKRLEAANAEGAFEELTKKERLLIERKIARLQLRLGGLRSMERLPSLMFVVDVRREQTAVKEANIMKIPVIALVDTNCDPDMIDFVIPSNDDAIRAIKLLTSVISDAVNEGVNMRKAYGSDVEVAEITDMGYAGTMDEGALDEAYLGESTLAKLREGDLAFDDDIFEEDEDQPKRRR